MMRSLYAKMSSSEANKFDPLEAAAPPHTPLSNLGINSQRDMTMKFEPQIEGVKRSWLFEFEDEKGKMLHRWRRGDA
jgi:hypothetical protein